MASLSKLLREANEYEARMDKLEAPPAVFTGINLALPFITHREDTYFDGTGTGNVIGDAAAFRKWAVRYGRVVIVEMPTMLDAPKGPGDD